MKTEKDFRFLEISARDAGAIDARVIPAEGIIVENRGAFKCRSGCPYYATSLVCPPHAPAAEEFRAALRDYSQALVVRFQTSASVSDDIACSMLRMMADPNLSSGTKKDLQTFFAEFGDDCTKFYHAMLQLEREAFLAGYPFSLALMPGPCVLCETCSGIGGTCAHPTMKRYPADALGVNVIKTAELAGMKIEFPFHKSPSSIGILLIN